MSENNLYACSMCNDPCLIKVSMPPRTICLIASHFDRKVDWKPILDMVVDSARIDHSPRVVLYKCIGCKSGCFARMNINSHSINNDSYVYPRPETCLLDSKDDARVEYLLLWDSRLEKGGIIAREPVALRYDTRADK